MRFFKTALSLGLLLVAVVSCKREIIPDRYRPTHEHDAYVHALRMANLTETALGRDWIAASRDVFRNPISVELPFEEVFFADAAKAFAAAYVFAVLRGQRIEVDVDYQGDRPGRLFMDLFREGEDSRNYSLVASADERDMTLKFEPKRDANYLVRLQPELLRGGRFSIRIRKVPSLEFPVSGKDSTAILSRFGDPRDGGRRDHHGVDIFAPRHTPVIAPSNAYVRRVRTSDVGGNHIWLQDDDRNLNMYFAHLHTQDVKAGDRVKAGQQIGTVGNTGNARTTPPHLHFGIYARREGPIDPVYFIKEQNIETQPITAELGLLGHWVRTDAQRLALRSEADRRSRPIEDLEPETPMQVLGAAGEMYRVRLPDEDTGYVESRKVKSAGEGLSILKADQNLVLKSAPRGEASIVAVLNSGDKFAVLGRYRDYLMVRTRIVQQGWLSQSQMIPAAGEEGGN